MTMQNRLFDNKVNYILFPALTMLLGWGLRGYIGGGPFGAMIPGAMVAISLSIMLDLPVKLASVLSVFGVVAIGLGGEMTYGQTLGFLRDPSTVWWGTLGTSVKGGVWGLLGGTIIAMGLNYNRLSRKSIIIAFLLLMTGMLAGFKLINQPMLIYFSDRSNPRPESWAALLSGAIALLLFLRSSCDEISFRIIIRFAMLGTVGGALGFGIGGFWLVLGSRLPDSTVMTDWWKAMEFTFGLFLGAFLGFAAWLSRKDIVIITADNENNNDPARDNSLTGFFVTLITGVLIFWAFAAWLDPVVDSGHKGPQFTMIGSRDMAIIFSNYAFYGFLMILAVIYFPSSAWMIAVALTFCHTVIDLSQDLFTGSEGKSMVPAQLAMILSSTLIVSALTLWFQRRKKVLHELFLLLTWSTVSVAFLRFFTTGKNLNIGDISFCEIVCGRFFVPLVFLASAMAITLISNRSTKQSQS